MRNKLLCFAHGRDDDWQAICLDLDIAVQGRSFEEVRDGLEKAVVSYLRDALKEEQPARRLLNRSAPWYIRLSYVVRFMFATIFKRDGQFRHAFDMPCAA